MTDTLDTYLPRVVAQYRQYKAYCERAAAQVSDDDFFATVGAIPLSVGVQLKHLAGNHRSRWRDFLTSDGEKRDRARDAEFVHEGETRAQVMEAWEAAWAITFGSLEALTTADLGATITIRGEPMTALEAIQRNLAHLAYHTGQVVQLARHFAGDDWQTLSVPVGASAAHNEQMRERFGDWWAEDSATGAAPPTPPATGPPTGPT